MNNPNPWFHGTWEPGHDISPQQTEFATALRVPFLTSPYPGRRYTTGIVIDDSLWHGIVPTDEEVEVVARVLTSYQDYFFPKPNRFRSAMEEFAPYDIDGGAVRFYFIKRPDGTWAFRRNSWGDRVFWPELHEEPKTLEEVISLGSLRWGRRTAI
jgi:hypothetical protein